ncbi:MAG: hypothetical protein KAQ92_02635 [Candidatus Aenigmarchaeota archaeon]|nr:hypothetical protein [Candidatus Aenigmarchaeota archaeon]
MSREEDLKKAEALLEEAKREALRLQKTNPEVAGEDLNRINNDFIELKEIQEDVNKIKEAEANNKLTPAKAKSILKKTGKFLRKVAHFTEKGNKDKNVSDGFKGLMGKVDFETKMANLNPYEQMIENLKEGNWKDYTKIDYFHDLIKILKETDNIHVRLNAISTLRNIGDSAIIPLCDEIERTEDKGMLYCYIDILRLIDLDKTDKTKINRVIDALIYALEKIKDDEKECNTILVIFSYMGKPALPKLKKVLNNCSDEVKRYIYEAIRRIDPENYLAFKEVNEFKNQFFEKIDKFKTPNILRDVQISPPKEVPDINNCVRYNFNYFEYRKDEKTKEVKKILGKSAGRSVIYEPFFKYFEYSIKNFVGDAGKSFLEEMTHIRSAHYHIDEMEINPDPLSQIKV